MTEPHQPWNHPDQPEQSSQSDPVGPADPSGSYDQTGSYGASDPAGQTGAYDDPYGPYRQAGAYDPYGQYGAHGYPYSYGYPATQPWQQQRRATPSWWTWPVVVAISLVIGLLGGTASTLLVLGAREGWFQSGMAGLDSRAPLPSNNRDVAKVAELLLPSTVQVIADAPGNKDATGSGFVIDNAGHVITNNHVVADAADKGKLSIVDYRGAVHKATIVGRSAVYDVAVLKVSGISGLPPAALGSSQKMHVGDQVVALGAPLGLSSTVTSGIVSALDRPVTAGPSDRTSFINAVQTDAAINPGNSGGPLVNLRGQVIGVNSAIATVSRKGVAGSIGVGFAIPMEQVRLTAQQIIDTGEAQYPVIGATVDIGARRNGALVTGVESGGPADSAGIRKDDVIVGIDDYVVHDGISLIVLIRSHEPGDSVTLRVRRGGQTLTFDLTLDGKVG